MRARAPPSTSVPAGTGANSAPSVAGAGGAISTCERYTRLPAAWSARPGQIWTPSTAPFAFQPTASFFCGWMEAYTTAFTVSSGPSTM